MIDTVEYAKDVVQEGFGEISDRLKGELSDRLKDASVELSDRLKDVSLAARGRPRRRRATMRVVLALVLAGGITAAVIVWWRLRAATEEDVAPDAFGKAVEAERERGIVEHAVRY